MPYDEGRWKNQGLPMAIHCLRCDLTLGGNFGDSHYHEYIELLWGLKGRTQVLVSGEIREFREKELMIVDSGEPHTLRAASEESSYIVIKFLPQIIYSGEQSVFELKYIIPFLLSDAKHPRVMTADDGLSETVGMLMEDSLAQWQRKSYGYELAIKGNILILFSRLLENWHEKKLISSGDVGVAPQTLRSISKAIEYASLHPDEADENTLAAVAGYSAAYFSRCFSKVMHMNFSSYITFLRLSKAEKLLASSDLSITQIAENLGYSTSSHFSQQFKKYKKCTPSAFRSLMGRAEAESI